MSDRTLTYEDVLSGCTRGGPTHITSVTTMEAAAGPQASVTAAKYVPEKSSAKSNTVNSFEIRWVNGAWRTTVTLDSTQSHNNRQELALSQDKWILDRLPLLAVGYVGGGTYYDLTLPHRCADAHLRLATIDGIPASQHQGYRTVRDATVEHARPLLEHSPISLLYGVWDSTRPGGIKLSRAVTSDVVGTCRDSAVGQPAFRGGARLDPLGQQLLLSPEDAKRLLDASDVSAKLRTKIESEIEKARKDKRPIKTADLVLGGIPPVLGQLGGVACDQIIRSQVLSFPTLRRLNFDLDENANAAWRAVLAALFLYAVALSDGETDLRSGCELVEASPTVVTLRGRQGRDTIFAPLTVEEARSLLDTAITKAEAISDITWRGQRMEFVGDSAILASSLSSGSEDNDDE